MEKLNSELTILNTPCFEKLTIEQLDSLTDKKKQLKYFKGENIFKQDAFSSHIIYIIEGAIKIYLQTSNQKQINLRIACSGDFVAFESIFSGNYYNYSANALKDSIICMINKEALKNLLVQNPQFGIQITTKNMQNEVYLIETIKNLSAKHMRGKLAYTLLYLSGKKFEKENIFQLLTRKEIANFASISNENAIKYLKEFEKENIISLKGKDIKVIDKKNLELISKIG